MMTSRYHRIENPTQCQVCGSFDMALPRLRRAFRVCSTDCAKERRRQRDTSRAKPRPPEYRSGRNEAAKRRRLEAKARRPARECVLCGTLMPDCHHAQKTCSEICRRKWRLAERMRRIESDPERLRIYREKRRAWFLKYLRDYRKRKPEKHRRYVREFKDRHRDDPKFVEARRAAKRRWEVKRAGLVQAILDMGLVERPPISRDGERKRFNAAVVAAARELGLVREVQP